MFDQQSVWRAVHTVAAQAALSSEKLDLLRSWAAKRMREQPFAVFDGFAMRSSFPAAIRQAARVIRTGASPD